MKARLIWSALVWGLALWLFGYALGIVFFMLMPQVLIGWAIMPFGIAVTLWVLIRKIKGTSLRDYVVVSIIWTALAIMCDYFFLVVLLQPAGGYYKPDVYVYYSLTFLLPIVVGLWKRARIDRTSGLAS